MAKKSGSQYVSKRRISGANSYADAIIPMQECYIMCYLDCLKGLRELTFVDGFVIVVRNLDSHLHLTSVLTPVVDKYCIPNSGMLPRIIED